MTALLAVLGCSIQQAPPTRQVEPSPTKAAPAPPAPKPAPVDGRFRPLPEVKPLKRDLTRKKLALGRDLYQRLDCGSCHPLDRWGTDGQRHAAHGSAESVDTPSVFMAALQQAQFHDARAPVVEVASQPSDNKGLEDLKKRYYEAFPFDDPYFTPKNTGIALATFVRRLVGQGDFDRYLRTGEGLTEAEEAGFATFQEVGCGACHFGFVLGGNRREDGTRIPGLRNVRHTGPWFSRGQIATLDEAIQARKGHHDRQLAPEELVSVRTFLDSLDAPPVIPEP